MCGAKESMLITHPRNPIASSLAPFNNFSALFRASYSFHRDTICTHCNANNFDDLLALIQIKD